MFIDVYIDLNSTNYKWYILFHIPIVKKKINMVGNTEKVSETLLLFRSKDYVSRKEPYHKERHLVSISDPFICVRVVVNLKGEFYFWHIYKTTEFLPVSIM